MCILWIRNIILYYVSSLRIESMCITNRMIHNEVRIVNRGWKKFNRNSPFFGWHSSNNMWKFLYFIRNVGFHCYLKNTYNSRIFFHVKYHENLFTGKCIIGIKIRKILFYKISAWSIFEYFLVNKDINKRHL